MGNCFYGMNAYKPEKAPKEKKALDYSIEHNYLLLGTGHSGKSTFIRQMINTYSHGYPDWERALLVESIRSNILRIFKTILTKTMDEKIREKFDVDVDPSLYDLRNEILNINVLPSGIGLEAFVEFIINKYVSRFKYKKFRISAKKFWLKDEGFMRCYEARDNYYIMCSTPYLLSRLDDILDDNYLPTKEDVLRCETRTTGINQVVIKETGHCFRAGQRSERRKWAACNKKISAIFYFAAISEYNEKLDEAENQNSLCEALNLFEIVCTSSCVYFTKCDIFDEKVENISIKDTFDRFEGDPHDREQVMEFIKGMFLERGHMHFPKTVVHETVVTDCESINKLFEKIIKVSMYKKFNEGLT